MDIYKLIFVFIALFLFSCNRGYYLPNGAYRPKRAEFSIVNKPFNPNKQLVNSHIYLVKDPFIDASGEKIYGYMGFYPDGKMIVGSGTERVLQEKLSSENLFSTSFSIGYYTTNGNAIEVEYFVPDDGGRYHMRAGIIENDYIVFFKKVTLLMKKEIRKEVLVKSKFVLK
jgi:hypothetical protein